MKEKWEIALEKFISEWRNKKEVVGAVVCGSYITGNPSKHSDIDVQIILDRKITWRERGNKIVDGVLIEYFANPLPQNIKYLEEGFEKRDRMDVHMFLTGRVLFDKTGDVGKIIAKAKEFDKKQYKRPDKISIEIIKYGLWDTKDNLQEVYESGSKDFYFVYFNALNRLLDVYSKFLGFDKISPDKVMRLLTNKRDKAKYRTRDFPDVTFVSLYVKAMELTNRDLMLSEFEKLTNHVLDKMGGFEIDGWKIRSPIDGSDKK